MANCDFTKTDATSGRYRWWVCSQCGRRTKSPFDREPFATCEVAVEEAKPIAPREPCPHQGEQLRLEKCGLCGARDEQVPVYACAIHGECVRRKVKAKIHVCYGACD